MKPSLNRSINAKNQNAIRNMHLPPYSDEHVLVEIAKLNKELRKKGKYELRVDYYDNIYEDVHHYYGNNSGFGNQRVLMICLLHEEVCISSLFFERNGKDIDINVATKPEYEKRGINSFLHAVAIRVIHLGFKYKEIYSSAINPISAWILIKDYDVSASKDMKKSISEEEVKTAFPTFPSLEHYYKKDTLRIKVPIKKNAAKALQIEKKLFR
jgi:hypothetical protein